MYEQGNAQGHGPSTQKTRMEPETVKDTNMYIYQRMTNKQTEGTQIEHNYATKEKNKKLF